MAGHSKFKNIMHRKGAQDKKRSAIFSKLSREITVAAKMGLPDPEMNARLRAAVLAAKAQSRSEEHTSELQSRQYLVCRLLLEKKKNIRIKEECCVNQELLYNKN